MDRSLAPLICVAEATIRVRLIASNSCRIAQAATIQQNGYRHPIGVGVPMAWPLMTSNLLLALLSVAVGACSTVTPQSLVRGSADVASVGSVSTRMSAASSSTKQVRHSQRPAAKHRKNIAPGVSPDSAIARESSSTPTNVDPAVVHFTPSVISISSPGQIRAPVLGTSPRVGSPEWEKEQAAEKERERRIRAIMQICRC
jgi:hypothetical protein